MVPYIRLIDLQNEEILNDYIYRNKEINYYFTDDWSAEIYDEFAYAGFISITTKDELKNEYILAEMQFSYAVLTWDNFYISKRIKKLINKTTLNKNNYSITINKDIDAVFNGIKEYHKDINWLSDKYFKTLKSCSKLKLISVEVWDNDKLVAGEIGYIIGSIYTSLTGFFDRENYTNLGKLQLYSLALILKEAKIKFWNMGHPYMDYKFKMGALEYERAEFLSLWKEHRDEDIDLLFMNKSFECKELFNTIW